MLICVATRRHAYCSSTNQCLQILTPEKKNDSHFKTRSLSGTSNKRSVSLASELRSFVVLRPSPEQSFAVRGSLQYNPCDFRTTSGDFIPGEFYVRYLKERLIVLHYTTLHYTTLRCTALRCTALHCTISFF